jgi:aromatic ring-opening dioxygenase LigB subunit
VTLLAALVLDHGSDVPYAHLERQRVLRVHAAQSVHERAHVLHGAVRQALHAHEFPATSIREAGD